MKLYLNTSTGILSAASATGQPLRRIDAKRGDMLTLEVMPDASLTGALGVFAAKAALSGSPMALDTAWDAPATAEAGYVFAISLNTSELAALFTGETAEVALLAEITWSLAGAVRSSQTFSLVVARDVWVGDELNPTELPSAIATEAEAIAGTDNTKLMTPLRVRQAWEAWNA